jgi:hypothetical protein
MEHLEMIVRSDVKPHETTCSAAEMNRQIAVTAAAGNASAVRTAEVTFYRAVIASCVANGFEAGGFRQGLHDLTGSYS